MSARRRSRPLVASFPDAFKSYLARERRFWSAHVKVDYDCGRNPLRVRDLRALAAAMTVRRVELSKVLVLSTRKGYHLRVFCCSDIGPYTTMALQAAAGDDPIRQRFNRGRVRRGEVGWNVLWNEKWRNGKNIMKEKIDRRWTTIARKILSRASF